MGMLLRGSELSRRPLAAASSLPVEGRDSRGVRWLVASSPCEGAELSLYSGGAGVRCRGVSTSWKKVERFVSASRSLGSMPLSTVLSRSGELTKASSGSAWCESRPVNEARLVAARPSRNGYLACLSVGLLLLPALLFLAGES